MTVTRKDIAVLAVEGGDDIINEFVNALPAERIAPTILRVREMRQSLASAEQLLEQRYAVECNGNEWLDPETGKTYEFAGSAGWEVKDPLGLMAELRLLGQQDEAVGRVVEPLLKDAIQTEYKVSHNALNRIRDASDAAARVIMDFRTRTFGPKHLREKKP